MTRASAKTGVCRDSKSLNQRARAHAGCSEPIMMVTLRRPASDSDPDGVGPNNHYRDRRPLAVPAGAGGKRLRPAMPAWRFDYVGARADSAGRRAAAAGESRVPRESAGGRQRPLN